MARNAAKISLDEFKQKIVDYVNKNYVDYDDEKINLIIEDLDIKEYEWYKYSGEIMRTLLEISQINKDIKKNKF